MIRTKICSTWVLDKKCLLININKIGSCFIEFFAMLYYFYFINLSILDLCLFYIRIFFSVGICFFFIFHFLFVVIPLSANITKWWNILKQFVGNLPTNCLSVFDYFVKLALKGLIRWSQKRFCDIKYQQFFQRF